MTDKKIKEETSLNFTDNTSIDIGISDDGDNRVVLIVEYPNSSAIDSSVSCQIEVNLNKAEANMLFEVIRSKIQLLDWLNSHG